MKCKPPERTPQLGQNGLTNRAQDNKENEKRRLPTENAIEPYYSATTIATIAVASVVHDNWMRTCVQDNKRIQDNERIPCTKRETDTSCIPTTTITTEIKTETRTEITTEKTTEITSETTSETKKPHIRDLDLKKGMYTCRTTAIELRAVWTKKTKKYDKPISHTWLCNFSFA